MFKNKKGLACLALGLSLAMGMTGCSSLSKKGGYSVEEATTTKALMIGKYEICIDELVLYAMQTAFLQGASSESLTDQSIANNKNTALSLVRTNKIIYNVAIENDVELDESDKEYVDKTIANFKNRFPAELLDKYGITDALLDRVFSEQAIVSKFENDIKNDMGQKATDAANKEYGDLSFHTIYYMLFPTVQIANGAPVTDANGNYEYVTAAEKTETKKVAEAAVKEIQGGASYEEVAEKYGVTSYSGQRSGFVGAYSDDEMNETMGKLKNGQCVGPLDDTLGYAVIVMISADDESLKQSYISNFVNENVTKEFDTLQQAWLATIAVDEQKDLVGTSWKDFDYKQVVKDMEKLGILAK